MALIFLRANKFCGDIQGICIVLACAFQSFVHSDVHAYPHIHKTYYIQCARACGDAKHTQSDDIDGNKSILCCGFHSNGSIVKGRLIVTAHFHSHLKYARFVCRNQYKEV